MTTDARRAANRRNATASTGPRTQTGKATSSRNARKHGLRVSAPSEDDRAMVDALTAALMSTRSDRKDDARAAAEARCHLDRVRSAKVMVLNGATARIEATQLDDQTMSSADLEAEILLAALNQHLILDDYERKAASRFRRALRAFWEN